MNPTFINQNNKDSLLKNYEKEEKSIFRDCLAYLSLHDPLLNSSENDYNKNQSSNWKTLLDQSQARRNSLSKISLFDRQQARLQIPRVNIERIDIPEIINETSHISNFAKKSKSHTNILENILSKRK